MASVLLLAVVVVFGVSSELPPNVNPVVDALGLSSVVVLVEPPPKLNMLLAPLFGAVSALVAVAVVLGLSSVLPLLPPNVKPVVGAFALSFEVSLPPPNVNPVLAALGLSSDLLLSPPNVNPVVEALGLSSDLLLSPPNVNPVVEALGLSSVDVLVDPPPKVNVPPLFAPELTSPFVVAAVVLLLLPPKVNPPIDPVVSLFFSGLTIATTFFTEDVDVGDGFGALPNFNLILVLALPLLSPPMLVFAFVVADNELPKLKPLELIFGFLKVLLLLLTGASALGVSQDTHFIALFSFNTLHALQIH